MGRVDQENPFPPTTLDLVLHRQHAKDECGGGLRRQVDPIVNETEA